MPRGEEKPRAADYKNDPNVQYAELNGIYRAIETTKEKTNAKEETNATTNDATTSMTPTDSRVGEQWAYNNTGNNGWTKDADIDAFEAWDITLGSASVPVAVLDTGIGSHVDLQGQVTKNVNCTTSASTCDPNVSAMMATVTAATSPGPSPPLSTGLVT